MSDKESALFKLDAATIMWESNCSARRKQNNEKLLSVSQSVVGAHLRAGGCWEFKAPYVRSFHPVLPFLETRRRKARVRWEISLVDVSVCSCARTNFGQWEHARVQRARRKVPFFKLIGSCVHQCPCGTQMRRNINKRARKSKFGSLTRFFDVVRSENWFFIQIYFLRYLTGAVQKEFRYPDF